MSVYYTGYLDIDKKLGLLYDLQAVYEKKGWDARQIIGKQGRILRQGKERQSINPNGNTEGGIVDLQEIKAIINQIFDLIKTVVSGWAIIYALLDLMPNDGSYPFNNPLRNSIGVTFALLALTLVQVSVFEYLGIKTSQDYTGVRTR